MSTQQLVFKSNEVFVATSFDKMSAVGALKTGTVRFGEGGYTENTNAPQQIFSAEDGYAVAESVRWGKKINGINAKIVPVEWCDRRDGFHAAEDMLWREVPNFRNYSNLTANRIFKINKNLWATADGIMPLKEWISVKQKQKKWIYSGLDREVIQMVSSLEEVAKIKLPANFFDGETTVCKVVLDRRVSGASYSWPAYSWEVANWEALLKTFKILYCFDKPGWSKSD